VLSVVQDGRGDEQNHDLVLKVFADIEHGVLGVEVEGRVVMNRLLEHWLWSIPTLLNWRVRDICVNETFWVGTAPGQYSVTANPFEVPVVCYMVEMRPQLDPRREQRFLFELLPLWYKAEKAEYRFHLGAELLSEPPMAVKKNR
jgi:hypothetical protein